MQNKPTAHQTIGLATLGRNSASLEGYDTTPVEKSLMSPRGGVNRRDNQIKLFFPEHLS
jgi:hypothetical protein